LAARRRDPGLVGKTVVQGDEVALPCGATLVVY
jgi:hypothetical protein